VTISSGSTEGETLDFDAGDEPVAPRKLSALVADKILDRILRNGLKPGARLPPEAEMRQQLGVGRGTVREALRLLEAQGLITVRSGPQGGPVVEELDIEHMTRLLLLLLIFWEATLRDVYEVREVLDPLVAGLAAQHASDEQIEQLRESVKALHAASPDEEGIVAENQLFHQLLGEASGNPVLAAFVGAITRIFDGYAMGTGKYGPKEARKIADFHDAIAEAVANGDTASAQEAARNHINDAVKFFERRHRGLLDEPLRPTLLQGSPSPAGSRRPKG
jgi:GntR family transcriptional regulator, transcriptional repressor for pyruvate dehydrogenase complex